MIESPTSAPALELRGLTRRFGGVIALDDVSLTVARGQSIALMGPNGAGKSTCLRLIAGQDRPTSGEVMLDGEIRVSDQPAHKVARLGVALARQIPRPLRRLTVRQNILVGARAARHRLHVSEADHVDQILASTELAPKARLLGGQLPLLDLKRLELARAMALNPGVLLLDEVGAGLSESELDVMVDLIRDVHLTGVTLVVVEHITSVVQALAQHVVVLDWGNQIASGTPHEMAEDERVREVYLGGGKSTDRKAHRSEIAGHERVREVYLGGGESTDRKAHGRSGPQLVSADVSDPILELEGVSASYGVLPVLEDVSIRIGAREVITVLGRNGAGKSTLARTISGLMPLAGGTVRWQGDDISELPPHERVRHGIVYCQEGRRIFEGLTVEENLRMGAFTAERHTVQQRLDEVHKIFPVLDERAKQDGTTLSGGQQQMLAIARALMTAPRLLLLDEVTLGLSPKAADGIYAALERIATSGVAMVLVEQSVHRSLSLANRAYVLDQGRVVFDGNAHELDESRVADMYFGQPPRASPVPDGRQTTVNH